MEPIAVTVRGEHRWVLIHRCTRCGRLRLNRAAADDNVLLLVQLAALPLATPPVPYLHPAAVPAPGFTASGSGGHAPPSQGRNSGASGRTADRQ
jgi:RNHCP domain